MFNNKRIEELEKSVKSLTALVDMQSDALYGYTLQSGVRAIALVEKVTMLVDHLGVEYVHPVATIPSYQKIKKGKK
jgi:purine-nucleoside phosphorylase